MSCRMFSSLCLHASSHIPSHPAAITRQVSRCYQCPLKDSIVSSGELVVRQLDLAGFEVNSDFLIVCTVLVFYCCCLYNLLLLSCLDERKNFLLLRIHGSTTFKIT